MICVHLSPVSIYTVVDRWSVIRMKFLWPLVSFSAPERKFINLDSLRVSASRSIVDITIFGDESQHLLIFRLFFFSFVLKMLKASHSYLYLSVVG